MKSFGGPLAAIGAGIVVFASGAGERMLPSKKPHSHISAEESWEGILPPSSGGGGGSNNPSTNPTDPNDPNNLPPGEGNPTADTDGDGIVSNEERDAWIRSLPNGKKAEDGRLTITTYGRDKDPQADSNTLAQRGFSSNLLREGSVALSPDLYKAHNPQIGASVYINGQFVGYYEDRTPASYKGQNYGNVVDIYNPSGSLGDQSKILGSGTYTITFGKPRDQIRNP
jgi:hypothetical protein